MRPGPRDGGLVAIGMAAQAQIDVGGILRPRGRLDLSTALHPIARSLGGYALGERAAAHLLRRAGFGGTPDEIVAIAVLTAESAA